MSRKLAAKNAMIEMPVSTKPAVATDAAASQVPRTRTAVGGMAQFVTTQSPIHREAEELRRVVESFEGARVVRAVAPSSIVASQWANRHIDSFESADFGQLKREIQEAGGNVQPIKIRPLNGSTPGDDDAARFEIVFGHRRHRACLELNIPVNALIEAVDDQTLFEQMERENRGRKNLSAWEQGCMYLAALEKGLYPSQRKLSESIGVDISLISKSLALARLPKALIDAFASPLDIQFRWAQPLGDALQKDPEGVIGVATKIREQASVKPLGAAEVFARLTEGAAKAGMANVGLAKVDEALKMHGKRVGDWVVGANGAVTVFIKPGALSAERQDGLLVAIQAFLQAD